MQPLSYQIGRDTCWITSMINGVMFLRNGKRIKSFEYKTLHAALDSMLWGSGVSIDFDDNEERSEFEHSLRILRKTFNISFGTDQNPTIHLYTCERLRPEARGARGLAVR